MNNIIITGACGTTGTALVKFLLSKTPDIIYGFDNFYKGGSKNNLEIIRSLPQSDRFIFKEVDCNSAEFYNELEYISCHHDITQIYNLYAIVETPRFYDSPYETYRTNCVGAIELFKWASNHGVDKFVNCSSSEIYGHPTNDEPIEETSLSTYDSVESSTRWSYAHGKILTEYIINQLSDKSSTKVCHLRYANVYGEHDTSPVHVIPYILHQLVYHEPIHINKNYHNIRRTFLHNDDSMLGTYLAMNNMTNKSAYNIGSDEEVTIKELLDLCTEVVEELLNRSLDPSIIQDIDRPGDPIRRVLSTKRANSELGFKCKVSLRDGIRRTALAIIDEYDEIGGDTHG